jgi:hypothetical protein
MDLSEEGKLPWNPSFWAKAVSWKNKWKKTETGWEIGTERWFTSSTITVFLTDGWHLMQFIFLNALFLAAFGLSLKCLILRIGFGVVFEGVHRLIGRK